MYFTPALRGVCELRHVAAPMLSRRRLGDWCCGASQIISSARRARQRPRSTPRKSPRGPGVCRVQREYGATASCAPPPPPPCDRCVRQTVLNRWPRRDDRRSRGAHPQQRMRAMGAARLQCRARNMRKCCRQSNAETRDRAGDLQIFSLTLSQLSYRGGWALTWCGPVGSLLALSESPEDEKLKSPEQLAKSRIPLAPSNSNCRSEGLSIGTIG